jgi:hypothetical protein
MRRREHLRSQVVLYVRARRWLAKGALASSLFALVATSSPPEWHVEDEAREPFVFVAGQANTQVTAATVIYRTPRGTWPFSVTHDVHLSEVSDDRSHPAAAHASLTADRVTLVQSSHLDERTRFSTKTDSDNAFEVVCEEAECEGSLEIDLRISWNSPEPPRVEDIVVPQADAGVGSNGSAVTLRASFFGGPDKPMFGCDAKDSSNDLDDAPKKLGIDVTLLPFQPESTAGVVPGASPDDASVALPPLAGLDAGL